MNDENEITEMWREIRKDKQHRHENAKKSGLEILSKSGLSYRLINNDECALFREEGYPRVDYYPSSGRWKWIHTGEDPRYFEGGATSFINWYKKHKEA